MSLMRMNGGRFGIAWKPIVSKGVRLVLVAANGLKDNAYRGNVQSVETLDSLFLQLSPLARAGGGRNVVI